jgi:co-chaperonin GroES (HSP10)
MTKEINIENKELKQESIENCNLFSDLILVKPVTVDTETKGNIILPGGTNTTADLARLKNHPFQAEVLKVGSGIINDKKINMEVEVGDLLFLITPLDLNREAILIDGAIYGLIHKSKIYCSFKSLK